MKARYIIIGCAVLAFLGAVTLVGGALVLRWLFMRHAGAPRAPIGKPGILTGQGFLTKSTYLKDERLGKVTDIVTGQLDGKPGTDTGFAGDYGALIVSGTSSAQTFIRFSSRTDRVNIVDVQNDGVCEFMNRGSWAVSSSVMDHTGGQLWSYGGDPGVDDMASGDINRDGKLEFVVGFNGGGGVHLLTSNGRKLWQQDDGNVWHVEMVDANKDGKLEIVHSNAAGQITVRNDRGDVLGRYRAAEYFSSFSLCDWGDPRQSRCLLQTGKETIWLFGFDGSTIARLDAPKCDDMWDAYGVPVKLKPDKADCLAVIAVANRGAGAVLYVYDPSKSLVYQEILPSGSSVAAMPVGSSGVERLLVGGDGIVWSYTAN